MTGRLVHETIIRGEVQPGYPVNIDNYKNKQPEEVEVNNSEIETIEIEIKELQEKKEQMLLDLEQEKKRIAEEKRKQEELKGEIVFWDDEKLANLIGEHAQEKSDLSEEAFSCLYSIYKQSR